MGIFRRKIEKTYDVGAGLPILIERETTKKVSVGDCESEVVLVEKVDPLSIADSMPTRDEYDLDEQLKAGVHPKQINVRGMLPSGDFENDAIVAFSNLQQQIYELSSKEEVSNESKID